MKISLTNRSIFCYKVALTLIKTGLRAHKSCKIVTEHVININLHILVANLKFTWEG